MWFNVLLFFQCWLLPPPLSGFTSGWNITTAIGCKTLCIFRILKGRILTTVSILRLFIWCKQEVYVLTHVVKYISLLSGAQYHQRMIPADSGDDLTETMLLALLLCFHLFLLRPSLVPAGCVFDLEPRTWSAPLLFTSVLYYHQTSLICSPAVWFQALFGLLTLMEPCLVAWCSSLHDVTV